MNDGKKRRSSAELSAHKRFAKSRSRRIYPAFQNIHFVFCGDWGSAPTKQSAPAFRLQSTKTERQVRVCELLNRTLDLQ